jgi:putative ABC transport system permease protein
MVIGVFGGVIGTIFGVSLLLRLVAHVVGWEAIISVAAIVIAVVFSVGIGLFFGIYPAKKAALLDPIDALRYE